MVDRDPYSGHLFVFRNRPGDKLKILFWDRSGFCLIYKRLEAGTYRKRLGLHAIVREDLERLEAFIDKQNRRENPKQGA